MPSPAGLLGPAPRPEGRSEGAADAGSDASARASRALRFEVGSLAGGKNDNSA
jgi:hypothetical protein